MWIYLLESNYVLCITWFIVGKLSITNSTTIPPAVLLCNFSLTHCIFYTLSTSYCLKLNEAFRGNKTPTQSTVLESHTVKPINLSTQNLKAKPNSHQAVLVTNCPAVTTGGTWVKTEKFDGSENPSWSSVRRITMKMKDIFPFLTLIAVRQGLERNACWAAAWDWKLNVVSIGVCGCKCRQFVL